MKLDDLFGDVFQLLLKSETREKYPALNEYFTKKGKNHALGTTRIGDQIDLIPVSSQVARDSDIARNLNAGVKKKESQRQREKRMKDDAERRLREAQQRADERVSAEHARAVEQKTKLEAALDAERAQRERVLAGAAQQAVIAKAKADAASSVKCP